jgi:uncharacterized protein YdaU (DUF1376 family)
VNYYEHHLGDWAAATGHLTWDEDMAYTRLLRAYYHHEKPIAQGQQYRLAKASTPVQRRAVDQVLSEFFELRDGHYHQKRADAEIAKYREKEPEREAKKDNERERQRRTRERRKALFDLLRDNGVVPAYDAPMSELQTLASRLQSRDVTQPVTRDATATHTQSQTPDTRHQTGKEREKVAAVATTPPPSPPLKPADLVAEGVDPQAAADWMALRKAKRLPLTPTAWADTKAEGEKAGLTPPQTVAKAVANNWAGFKAAWLQRDGVVTPLHPGGPVSKPDAVAMHNAAVGLRFLERVETKP